MPEKLKEQSSAQTLFALDFQTQMPWRGLEKEQKLKLRWALTLIRADCRKQPFFRRNK